MNGDGKLDVVVSAFADPDIAVLFGNGMAPFKARSRMRRPFNIWLALQREI
jgi:hypothetical protein